MFSYKLSILIILLVACALPGSLAYLLPMKNCSNYQQQSNDLNQRVLDSSNNITEYILASYTYTNPRNDPLKRLQQLDTLLSTISNTTQGLASLLSDTESHSFAQTSSLEKSQEASGESHDELQTGVPHGISTIMSLIKLSSSSDKSSSTSEEALFSKMDKIVSESREVLQQSSQCVDASCTRDLIRDLRRRISKILPVVKSMINSIKRERYRNFDYSDPHYKVMAKNHYALTTEVENLNSSVYSTCMVKSLHIGTVTSNNLFTVENGSVKDYKISMNANGSLRVYFEWPLSFLFKNLNFAVKYGIKPKDLTVCQYRTITRVKTFGWDSQSIIHTYDRELLKYRTTGPGLYSNDGVAWPTVEVVGNWKDENYFCGSELRTASKPETPSDRIFQVDIDFDVIKEINGPCHDTLDVTDISFNIEGMELLPSTTTY